MDGARGLKGRDGKNVRYSLLCYFSFITAFSKIITLAETATTFTVYDLQSYLKT